jgi:hypothetical protein
LDCHGDHPQLECKAKESHNLPASNGATHSYFSIPIPTSPLSSIIPHRDKSFIPHRDKSFIPHRDKSFVPHRDKSFIPHEIMQYDISRTSSVAVPHTAESFVHYAHNSYPIYSSICLNTTLMFQVFTLIEPHLRPTSSLKPERWRNLLQHYPDSRFPELLSGIATYGARAGYEGPFLRIRGPNHSNLCLPNF